MAFKNQDKIALVRILSELVQADGLVNRNEILYLNHVYDVLHISPAIIKQSASLLFQDAVRQLSHLKNQDRYMVLKIFQQLTISDHNLSSEESFLLTALLLTLSPAELNMQAAKILSVSSFTRNVENHVLYLEGEYDALINSRIEASYELLVSLLHEKGYEFFYLPAIMRQLTAKKDLFREMLNYLQPELTQIQIESAEQHLVCLNTPFFAEEMFLNQLKQKDTLTLTPSFLFRLPVKNDEDQTSFLLLEIAPNQHPVELLNHFFHLQENILSKMSSLFEVVPEEDLKVFHRDRVAAINKEDDFQCYTGFHRMVIDTLLRHQAEAGNTWLEIDRSGQIAVHKGKKLEVRIPALARSLYLFFLHHPEGIRLDELRNYREEILGVYKRVSSYKNADQMRDSVHALTDYTGGTLNSAISRIKKAFTGLLGEEGMVFVISGEKAGKKKIHLSRELITNHFNYTQPL